MGIEQDLTNKKWLFGLAQSMRCRPKLQLWWWKSWSTMEFPNLETSIGSGYIVSNWMSELQTYSPRQNMDVPGEILLWITTKQQKGWVQGHGVEMENWTTKIWVGECMRSKEMVDRAGAKQGCKELKRCVWYTKQGVLTLNQLITSSSSPTWIKASVGCFPLLIISSKGLGNQVLDKHSSTSRSISQRFFSIV